MEDDGIEMGVFVNLLAVGRSLLVGAGLGVLRTPAGRADPLVFTPFEAALKATEPQRLRRVQELATGATFAGIGDLLAAGEFTATELTGRPPRCRTSVVPSGVSDRSLGWVGTRKDGGEQ
jgi:hypothetical protein